MRRILDHFFFACLLIASTLAKAAAPDLASSFAKPPESDRPSVGAGPVGDSKASDWIQVVKSAAVSNSIPGAVDLNENSFVLSATLPSQGSGLGVSAVLRHSVKDSKHVWIPHLAHEHGFVIADHSFRSPAFIFASDAVALALIPDIDDLQAIHRMGLRVWMDYEHPSRKITVAIGDYQHGPLHVTYLPKDVSYKGNKVRLKFHTMMSDRPEDLENPYGMATRWLWERWGRTGYVQGGSQLAPLSRYAGYTVDWALKPHPQGWGDSVWQNFTINGRQCGAPAFIVDVAQHASVPYEKRKWREPRSVWNQAWFSTQRCANGLLRYARQQGSKDLESKARLMTQLALSAPQTNGLFPSVYTTGYGMYKPYAETPGWEKAFWTNSDRRPSGASGDACHLLDASYTSRLLLEWGRISGDTASTRDYVLQYIDRLLDLQLPSGAFPGWVEPNGAIQEVLKEGPETAMSVSLLIEAGELFPGHAKAHSWREAAKRGLDYLDNGPIFEAGWEDFETYFSCSRWGQPGKKLARNGVFKSNTLSIYWCAEAFLKAFRTYGEPAYLRVGKRCLDELSLYQQIWRPEAFTSECHGGFGVMNADGEWNDARQSLFAPLYLDYYLATREPEYFERGVSALRASFAMMYCAENEQVRAAYQKQHPFFGFESFGFMMENIYHGGPWGLGIGPFTIFTWGNGAALSSYALIRDLYGDVYIDSEQGRAFGIDGCAAKTEGGRVLVSDRYGRKSLRALYSSGSRVTVQLDANGRSNIPLNPTEL